MGNLLFKERDKETKRTGGKKKMQAAQPVDLTAELAEVLRWREMEWSHIPPLSRKLVMPYLTGRDTINLDTAVTNKEDRKHLVKAYVGLRSTGLDGYAQYRVEDDGVCLGVRWAQKRSIDLRNFRLEYKDAKEDQDLVLYYLVNDKREELATYFATRCDVRDVDWYYISTLLIASEYGYLEIVQTLLGRGADVNQSNEYSGDTALHLASANGHVEVVRALLEAGADVRKGNRYGLTPISCACEGKHVEVFRALVEAGGDVNTPPDSDGWTALHDASEHGFTEGVRYLVERGADVNKHNTTSEHGCTPLFTASINGHVEVVRALLEAGADANMGSGVNGDTPLDSASYWGHVEVVRALLEAGADANMGSGVNGDTPLTSASYRGHVEVVRALLEAGADANKRDGRGRSPLSRALKDLKDVPWYTEQHRQGKAQVAALLREAGAQKPEQP